MGIEYLVAFGLLASASPLLSVAPHGIDLLA
jgi:hypothetical protein